jgi:uncharacterized membrane protein YdcZ (DUF606 family)
MTGLQIWNSSGTLMLDTTYYVGRFIGTVSVTNGQTGTYTNADLTNGTPFYVWVPGSSGSFGVPAVTFNGSTMTWNATGSYIVNGTLVVGIH